jgi:glycosyltransferase involved in cell wall biosynthesis
VISPRFLVFVPCWQAEKYIAHALESALAQDYPRDRFRIVCIVDHSPDGTLTEARRVLEAATPDGRYRLLQPTLTEWWARRDALLRETLDARLEALHGGLPDVVLMNPEHLGVVGNTWNLCHHLAEPDEIVVQLDGDDRLAHPGVLSRVAKAYVDSDAWMTYGSYAEDAESRTPGQTDEEARGIARAYDSDVHNRRAGWRATHLKTWHAWLFRKVQRDDLTHWGAWLDAAADHFIMLPMIEMASAAHARYLHEILYLKNDANPLCSHKYQQPRNLAAAAWMAGQPAYLPLAGPDDEARKEGD